jgi:hypothetical protein
MHLSLEKLIERISPSDRVLDLGGWERVFPRANVVADLSPYATRKIVSEIPEQFTEKDWIVADFCSPAFWNTIPDKAFDFIIISHTLEDIRDPLYVCSQMIRCGKAGYIEAPSKFRECAKRSATDTFSGYSHHRWIISPNEDESGLLFKAKLGWAHAGDYLGEERRHFLRSFHHGFSGYFWRGSFSYVEHFAKGPVLESNDLEFFYRTFDYRNPRSIINLKPNSSSEDDGKCLWVSQYKLPSETATSST